MATGIPWNRLVKGERYDIVDTGSLVATATFVKVRKRYQDMTELEFKDKSGPLRIWVYDDGKPDIRVLPAFSKKLALLNTKANLPPEMLGEIMKFNRPGFKGKSTKALLEAASKNPAVIEHERQKEEQRKTDEATRVQKEEDEEEARSREAIAAMKAGRSSRRRTRSSTSRRSHRSSLSKSRTTRRLYVR